MMKAIRTITAAVVLFGLLVSCQKENVGDFSMGGELVPVTLSASLRTTGTKVTYTETDNGSNYQLQPKWEESDIVIGVDEATPKNTYTFTVTDVDETTGAATLTGETSANCSLHLIYLSGAEASSITDGTLAVSYADQTGSVAAMPAVMVADGTVTNGTGSFTFHNAGAVIGIKAVKGAGSGKSISKITLNGSNLSAATVALNGSTLALTPTVSAVDAISTATLTDISVTDANGTLSTPVFIAVPAGAVVSSVVAIVSGFTYTCTLPSPVTLAANDYSYINGQTFTNPYNGHEFVDLGLSVLWATCNVGASKPEECGDYFAWGETEPKTDYSTNTYKFNAGEYQRFTKYISSKSYGPIIDNKTTLEPADDAARQNWGAGWRMPTNDEVIELFSNTNFSYTDNYNSTGIKGAVFKNKKDPSKSIFLPYSYYYTGTAINGGVVNTSYYWSSTVASSGRYAYQIYARTNATTPSAYLDRHYGMLVRPVIKE